MGCGVGVLQVSPEWFGYTEPYLTASSQEEQGVVGNCTQVPGGSTALDLFEPPHGNHPEPVCSYPPRLVPPEKMQWDKVRYG